MADKLTNNTDETTLMELFASPSIFEVPYFQRPYKWMPVKLRKFEKDLCRLADNVDVAELHFLGAIIIQGQQSSPVVAKTYQVIDGQQRLTTIFIYLLAAVRAVIECGDTQTAEALFKTYLAVSQNTGGKSNIKLHPSGQDRQDMNDVVSEVLSFQNFKEVLSPFAFKPLALGTANRQGRITKNFKEAKKFFKNEFQEGGIVRVKALYTAVLQNMTIVQIDIKDALSGPKIFDSLNSAQEPMTVGELVKNDIFSRGETVIDERVDQLESEVWSPFYEKFGSVSNGHFDDYFFPYGLFFNSSVKKAEVYPQLRAKWTAENMTPEQIIDELGVIQPDYLDLKNGTNLCGHPIDVHKAINDLWRLGIPTTLYPFLLHISYACRTNDLEEAVALALLRHSESFLVRRGAFGLEPSGLHAAFKGLWSEILLEDPSDLPKAMKTCINRRSTVKWPTADEFIQSLTTRSIYGSRVTPFILFEFNSSLGGDVVDGVCEIEHVLPQNPSSAWKGIFSESEEESLCDTIGNLTLVTSRMNQDVSNAAYSAKREVFREESRYKMTRDLANTFDSWTPEAIVQRSAKLADWAVLRWPHG
jgi:hypothetical protein